MHEPPPRRTAGIIAAGTDLARRLPRAAELPALLGFARSLAIYHGAPWRLRRMRRHYAAFLGPGDLAFDIGAHVGDRTRCWLRLGARVVAVEPQPRFAAWLRRRFRGEPRVTVVEAALGSQAGTATLFTSRRTPTVATLSGRWIEAVRHADSFAHVAWEDRREVPVTTLDQLIARHGLPRFCKIDVEGYEAEVLRGLSAALPALSFEVLPAAREVALAALDRLASLGRYRFNVSQGERLRLASDGWRGERELRAWLERLRTNDPSGDVYARLEG